MRSSCARHLRERGLAVTIVSTGAPSPPGDAADALVALEGCGVVFVDAPPSHAPALIVDGLFGVGLSRPPGTPHAMWIEWANASGAPILALDVPSGLDAGTGVAHAPTIVATATATFIALKPGLLTGDGPDHCGELSVHTLGLDADIRSTGVRLEWRGLQPQLPAILARRVRKTHKGTFGRACIVGGAEGLVGAALLAAHAALRLGAGRVVVGLAARNPPLVDWSSPELMLREASAVGTDHDAWVVGPGLGGGERAQALVEKAVALAQPLVLDADALNAIAADAALFESVARRNAPTIATPHPAEAARLLKCATSDVQADRVGAATRLASALHAHVVLKGAGSIVARPDATFDINASGNPALATAGSRRRARGPARRAARAGHRRRPGAAHRRLPARRRGRRARRARRRTARRHGVGGDRCRARADQRGDARAGATLTTATATSRRSCAAIRARDARRPHPSARTSAARRA